MVHQRASRAAVDGKLPVSKSSTGTFAYSRRLAFAAAAFFVTSTAVAHAQAGGAFAGMAGNWHGGGTVTLDDGSRERLRCRATYAVSGPGMDMVLICASDAYKFDLRASVVSEAGAVSGTWSETSRNVGGSLSGHSIRDSLAGADRIAQDRPRAVQPHQGARARHRSDRLGQVDDARHADIALSK